MSILVRNGRIITAERDYIADVRIEGEKIAEIGPGLESGAAQVIDASGKYVIPGGIDVHTHMDMPLGSVVSSDDFGTGTRAAAFGGTTCIVDFAIQSRGTRMRDALDTWWRKGEKAAVDYGLHMIITDLPDAHLEDMDEMAREGVTSFKLFMAYPGSLMVDDATIFRALRKTADNDGLICVHAENGSVIDLLVRKALAEGKTSPVYHALTRPAVAEGEAVNRAIALAQMAGVPVYIVHLSCSDGLEKVAQARDSGFPVFAETCPQYLLLSSKDLLRPGFEGAKYVFTPPPREESDQSRLWEGLETGVIQVVSTDHCPFRFKDQKVMGRGDFSKIPNGGPGVEHRLQLLYHHGVNGRHISLSQWVGIVSQTPAVIFGLYPRKGTVEAGSDADIVIWDPAQEYTISAQTHHMRVDYSLYEGFQVKGNAETVLARGSVIVDRGQWFGHEGYGKYVKRKACGRPEGRPCAC